MAPDYDRFINATKEGDRSKMEKFIDDHPQALTAKIFGEVGCEGIALHYVLENLEGRGDIAELLVNRMSADDLEIVDENNHTLLFTAVKNDYPVDLVTQIVGKNQRLPNIGGGDVPVYVASENEAKDMTRYLYGVTDPTIMNSMGADTMSSFLWNLVNMNLFDIATKIVQGLPDNLRRSCPYHTISALARNFPTSTEARAFLQMVWSVQSSSYDEWFDDETCQIIIENAESGSTEFAEELFRIRPDILENDLCRAKIISHAVKNRQKKVFNLVYEHIQPRDLLTSFHDKDKTKNNILHLAAELAPSYVLNRKSFAVLQMQSELQWFQELWNLASPECREARNRDGFTPRELLIETHKHLMEAGQKSMKEIAQSCTVIGALIVTIMFAASFKQLPSGNDKTGLPILLTNDLFKVFIICDAASLYLSTTSVLVCLGILMSRYAEDDFLVKLPRKLMIGLSTLFFSIITMMVAFCAALAIMLDWKLGLMLPYVLLALVPIAIFFWSTFYLLYDTYMSTYRHGIIDKNTNLVQSIRNLVQSIRNLVPRIRNLVQSTGYNRGVNMV